jgi:hypothetical protein
MERLMKHYRSIPALLLVLTSSFLAFAVVKPQEGKPNDKQIILSIKNPEDLIKLGKDELPKPEPKRAGLIISTNAPFSQVIINDTSRFDTDENGFLDRIFNFTKTTVTIVVKHPDFKELRKTLVLKIGTTKTVPLYLESKYGTLVLGGLPEKAEIFIDGDKNEGIRRVTEQSGGGIEKSLKIEKASFARISTGIRNLKMVHPDYKNWEGTFEVNPGNTEKNFYAPPLELAVSQLTVKATAGNVEALAGAKVYLDDKDGGQVAPDGKLLIENIRFRRDQSYKIRVIKKGYLEHKVEKVLEIGSNEIEVKLFPIPNSAQFDDFFVSGLSKALWEAPEEWKTEEGWLKVQGAPDLGFPRGNNYRDFDASFTFQMVNGKGAAWAVRIQKETNYRLYYVGGPKGTVPGLFPKTDFGYYLFYLGGPQGRFSGLFRTYVCRDGQFNFDQPKDAIPAIVKITPTDIYTIRVRVRGNKIEHFITMQTGTYKGREFPLGVYNDENSTFTFGNIGFLTLEGEVLRIDDFHILPNTEGEKIADK